jgi:hydrogenase/urease accessory protein HupE
VSAGPASFAHEVRPAYLEIKELTPGVHQVVWKQPLLGDRRLPIDPVFPEDCEATEPSLPENTGSALIQRWQVSCDLSTGLVHITGLSRTLTDVLVRVTRADGSVLTQLLRADQPTLNLGDPAPPVASYLELGIDHLLSGMDHILFVAGLVLFIPNRWMLLKTVSAFTAAHSITLALSVLNVVTLPQQPVEAVIALSILFLARELLLPEDRRSAITKVRPWLMAFAFGLLHGFGFAGALIDIGLPREQLALSLLLFNVGIEIGQILVIAALLATGWLISRIPGIHLALWKQAFTIIMGSMAGFWTIDRVWLVL